MRGVMKYRERREVGGRGREGGREGKERREGGREGRREGRDPPKHGVHSLRPGGSCRGSGSPEPPARTACMPPASCREDREFGSLSPFRTSQHKS